MYPSKYLDWISGLDGPASVILSILRNDVVLRYTVHVWRAENALNFVFNHSITKKFAFT